MTTKVEITDGTFVDEGVSHDVRTREEGWDPDVMTREEGYYLVIESVNRYWFGKKYYSLEGYYTREDIINEIYCKFLAKGLFEKYDSSIVTKEYFIAVPVERCFIDMLRKEQSGKRKNVHMPVSLQQEVNEDGITLGEILASDFNTEEAVLSEMRKEDIINSFSDTTKSKAVGISPYRGEVKMTMRVIAEHLNYGMSISEIAKMFTNPDTGSQYTYGRMQQIVTRMRQEILLLQ